MERRLAAILAADIVGYSTLMSEDEARTLEGLRQLRGELLEPVVAGQGGEVVKRMGDGWLVLFKSSADAVNCALQVQQKLAAHDFIKLRIGVHIGDVVLDAEDIFGDGVNIASRLQEICAPGRISISEPTYGSLDGTLRPNFSSAGPRALKNIPRPVQIWASVPIDADGILPQKQATTAADNPFLTLAIAPVKSAEADGPISQMASAMTQDLFVLLSSLHWLTPEVREDASGMDYNLRCDLMIRGNRVRATAQLFDQAAHLLWSEHIDGDLQDGFDWQDRTVEEITSKLRILIIEREQNRLAGKHESEMTVAEGFRLACFTIPDLERESYRRVFGLLTRGMQIDPNFGLNYTWACFAIIAAVGNGFGDAIAEHLPQAKYWAEAARELLPNDGMTQIVSLWLLCALGNRKVDFDKEIARALRLSPYDPVTLGCCGWVYNFLGRPEDALDCFQKGQRYGRYDPFESASEGGLAVANVQLGRHNTAVAHAKKALTSDNLNLGAMRALASAYAHLDETDRAKAVARKIMEVAPGDTVSMVRSRNYFATTPTVEHFLSGLQKAGVPD